LRAACRQGLARRKYRDAQASVRQLLLEIAQQECRARKEVERLERDEEEGRANEEARKILQRLAKKSKTKADEMSKEEAAEKRRLEQEIVDTAEEAARSLALFPTKPKYATSNRSVGCVSSACKTHSTCACTHACTHSQALPQAYTRRHAHAHTCTRTRTHTHAQIYKQTHRRTHTYTNTQTPILCALPPLATHLHLQCVSLALCRCGLSLSLF